MHDLVLAPLYAALGLGSAEVVRVRYDPLCPQAGDVVIRRRGLPDLVVEEKAIRPKKSGDPRSTIILELDAPGAPSFRSLRASDVIVFAFGGVATVDVYLIGTKALEDWIFLNASRCSIRRFYFPDFKDVTAILIKTQVLVHELGPAVLSVRIDLGCRIGSVFGLGEGFG
jgi:hypothetical protein